MKLIDWILLAAVAYLLYRLFSDRKETDAQIQAVIQAIPDPAKLAPVTIIQTVPATAGGPATTPITDGFTPVSYVEIYENA